MRTARPFPWNAIGVVGALLAASVQSACLGGISDTLRQTNVEIRNTVDTFDRAIDTLARQSSDWQVVLQDLEASISEDVQSTVRVELTNLLRTGVLGTGAEFRCDAEFLRLRTERELRRLRNDLAQELNNGGLRPPIPLLPIPAAEPYLCTSVPSAVDLSLDPARRTILDLYGFDLRSVPISAEVIDAAGGRTNVTGALGIISDTHMTLDLTSGGANLGENARQISLSWNNTSQSVIRVVSPSRPGPTCSTRSVVVPGSSQPQSFIPPHVRGDREYNGNGPCVLFDLALGLDLTRSVLSATYTMEAYECPDDFNFEHSDFTTARGTDTIELFRVSNPGDRILSFDVASSQSFRYIDNNHQSDLFTFAGTQPAEKLIFVGDTDGSEAGTETKVDIFFRQIRVTLEECR